MNLTIQQQHIDQISSLENIADELFEKQTFDSVMQALTSYCTISDMLTNVIETRNLSNDINYKLWKNKIVTKINDINASLATMKFKSYED